MEFTTKRSAAFLAIRRRGDAAGRPKRFARHRHPGRLVPVTRMRQFQNKLAICHKTIKNTDHNIYVKKNVPLKNLSRPPCPVLAVSSLHITGVVPSALPLLPYLLIPSVILAHFVEMVFSLDCCDSEICISYRPVQPCENFDGCIFGSPPRSTLVRVPLSRDPRHSTTNAHH